jgi:hypothetical protein
MFEQDGEPVRVGTSGGDRTNDLLRRRFELMDGVDLMPLTGPRD